MRVRNGNHPEYNNIRSQLKEAFKEIRKKKMYARMNFLCCGSCASYDLSSKLKNSDTKVGYVYWHSQDEETLKNRGYTHLGYGSKVEEDAASIGLLIVDILESMGIPHEWSGDPDERILVGVK